MNLTALLLAALVAVEEPGALRGRVLDAQTGEPIAKAAVSVRVGEAHAAVEATTDSSGHFVLPGVGAGEVELVVTTVGYGLARQTVRADDDVVVRLTQESLRRSEEVAVTAQAFDPPDRAAPGAHVLAGTELKNLANVLVDDPLRSVQALPGVAASDEFGATFAARGAGFDQVGFYVDGVLLNAPFHTIRDANDGFSLTLVNGDVVESLTLLPGSAPARYGDRTGPVLGLKLREGSRDGFFGRASLGATGLYATLEGPLGASKRTSWLVSARKSYLDYVLDRLDETGFVLGYHDVTARVSHHPSPAHAVTLGLLRGRSRWRNDEEDRSPFQDDTADAGTDLVTLQHRFLPSPRTWTETVAFVSRETGLNRSLDGEERFRARSSQWGLRTDATRFFGRHRLEGGLLVRRLAERVTARDFDRGLGAYRITEGYDANGVQAGAYVQDTWTLAGDRVSLTAGARLDRFDETDDTKLLPRASATVQLDAATRLLAGFGRYTQFPRFDQLFGRHGNPDLLPQGATHLSLGLERSLTATTRLRVEAYLQDLRDLPFTPAEDWRLVNGRVTPPLLGDPLQNALDGRSKGVELLLQRRSANGLSGWIAYAIGHARWHEDEGEPFDADFDQRHTVTVFGSYRVTPTLNLSAKYRYGSGFPVAGFYEQRPEGVFLSERPNAYRPEGYSRLDVRANKAFLFDGWKLTLYGEVINVLDRTHRRYTGLDGLDLRTGRAFLENDTLFPLLPSIGVTVEF
jgi:hypothetical protein